jgi:hypothetical protein
MRNQFTVLAASVLALALVSTTDAKASEGDGWQWVSAPYLWMSSIKNDLNEDSEPVPSETQFSDVISKLDIAFQGHFEGQGERFGAFLDVTYIALSDDRDGNIYSTEAALDTTMIEVAGVWNVEPARYEGLDVFAGVRHINADLSVDFDPVGGGPVFPPVTVGFDQSFSDFMLGARYTAKLSDKWSLITRVDGSWGDTDGVFNTSVMLGRKFEKGSLIFGYRYMNMELGDNGRSVDVTMQGPLLAFAFGL